MLNVSCFVRRPAQLLSRRAFQRHQFYGTQGPPPGSTYVRKPTDPVYVEPESTDASDETYPDVPRIPYQFRDPDAPWDDKQNRRNFGEPLNIDDEEINMWSVHRYDTVTDWKALRLQGIFFGVLGAFSAMMYFFFYPERVAVPRTYPDGLAKDMGARSEKDAHLYRVRVDKTYYDK